MSTVEDADFLAKGFARHLMRSGAEVYFACLWVERSSIELDESHDIARILAEFIEPFPGRVDHFVALKSIISGSCVVRSAMLRLLDQADPQSIHVAAPLVLEGAQDRLRRGFPPEIAERFRYWVLAEDKIKDTIGNVQPGIGGNVYERLGFVDQATKNRMMPAFVIERMTARQSREPRPRMT